MSDETFLSAYLEAMVFTDMSDIDDECRDSDFSAELIEHSRQDCELFQSEQSNLLALAYERDGYGPTQAGHDFWLSRNGHGAGFFDRRELEADDLGDRLQASCGDFTVFPGVDMYKGDDGEAYLA